jgi:hypothetical protein
LFYNILQWWSQGPLTSIDIIGDLGKEPYCPRFCPQEYFMSQRKPDPDVVKLVAGLEADDSDRIIELTLLAAGRSGAVGLKRAYEDMGPPPKTHGGGAGASTMPSRRSMRSRR